MTWTLDRSDPLPVWLAAPPSAAAVLAFSTRRGGVSDAPFDSLNLGRSTPDDPERVAVNRRTLLTRLGLDPARLVTAGQVHGARIVEVSEPGHVPECDALVTRARGLALAVTTADCMPLILTAPGAVAVVHAGWRGAAEGLPALALRELCRVAACAPDRIEAHLGPCIRSCCYEVGAEVAERFAAEALRPWGERWRLDLPVEARRQLGEAGLSPEAFHDVGACTMCEPHFYYSHRRDGAPSGRHWAVAALR